MENIGDFLVVIGLAFALAYLVEGTIEYFLGLPIDNLPFLKAVIPLKPFILPYAALAVAVFACAYWKIDLIAAIYNILAVLLKSANTLDVSSGGMVFTGLAVGRGSSYLHDWLKAVLKRPDVVTP